MLRPGGPADPSTLQPSEGRTHERQLARSAAGHHDPVHRRPRARSRAPRRALRTAARRRLRRRGPCRVARRRSDALARREGRRRGHVRRRGRRRRLRRAGDRRALDRGRGRAGAAAGSDRLLGIDGAPAVRLLHRLAGDEAARRDGHLGHRSAVHALQQPDRVRHRLHARADRRAGRGAPESRRGQGVERRRSPRHRAAPRGSRPARGPRGPRRHDRRGDRRRGRGLDRRPGECVPGGDRAPVRPRRRRPERGGARAATSGSCRCFAWTRCPSSCS